MSLYIRKIRWFLVLIAVFCFSEEGRSQTAISSDSSDFLEFTNGARYNGRVDIHQSKIGTPYLSINDTGRYQIYDMASFQIGGIPYKKFEWVEGSGRNAIVYRKILKTILQGRINVYSRSDLRSKESNDSFDFFSKDSREIKKIDYMEIRKALADNEKSLEILDQSDKWQMIKTGLAITGGTMFLYGVYSSFQFSKNDEINVDPMLYCGMGVFISKLFFGDKVKLAISSAIQNYNQSPLLSLSQDEQILCNTAQEIGFGISRWGAIAYELNFGWHHYNGDSYWDGFDLFFGFSNPKTDEGLGRKLENTDIRYQHTTNLPATETINQFYMGIGYCHSSFGLSGFLERERIHRFANYQIIQIDSSKSAGFIPLDIETNYGAGIGVYGRIEPFKSLIITPRISYGILRRLTFGVSLNIKLSSR